MAQVAPVAARTVVGLPAVDAARFRTLVDAWVLLATLWYQRLVHGRLEPALVVFACILVVLVARPRRLARLSGGWLEDLGPLGRDVVNAFAASVALALVVPLGEPRAVLEGALAAAPALACGRAVSAGLGRRLSRALARPRALVLGGGEVARRIIAHSARPEYGFEVVGVVDDRPRYSSSELGAPVLGGLDDLPAVVEATGVRHLVVSFSLDEPRRLVALLRRLQRAGISIWVVPRLFELGYEGAVRDAVWNVPLLRLAGPPGERAGWAAKRALDVALALLGLVLGAPVMAAIALAVLIDSGRPVLLRQVRLARDGRPFVMFKFRTMRPAPPEVEATEWAADGDRVTRVGRMLRALSLDELPQLVNVLRGEMSLVGPRPERPHFVHLFSADDELYADRHRVPPGITGLSQIKGMRGADSPIPERAALDNFYIDNWSLGEDLKILARTLRSFRESAAEADRPPTRGR